MRFAPLTGGVSCPTGAPQEDGDHFEAEIQDTVRRAVSGNHTIDNLALEINGLKFAQNRTFGVSRRRRVGCS